MEILHCRGQAAFLMRQEGCPNNHAPNNNTPVKTGVLWGCMDGVGDDSDGYGQTPPHSSITPSRSSTFVSPS